MKPKSEMLAFEIYRTEVFTFDDERFTVRFTKRKDGEEYALYATKDQESKGLRCSYSPETADSFLAMTGQSLADEVYKILKDDIERGAAG